jgi:hypothetical protein
VIESILANSEVPFEWRILLFIWRMSWGHNSDFAIDRIDGKQIGQNVCAEFFGVDKRRVSDAVVLLRGMGYILPRKGQALYPGDCLPSATSNAEIVSKVQAPADFSAFLEVWRVRAPADFRALASADANREATQNCPLKAISRVEEGADRRRVLLIYNANNPTRRRGGLLIRIGCKYPGLQI